jgi:hypothetical protein
MTDGIQFDLYRFLTSQNNLNLAKDELDNIMTKVSELFVMPKDMPNKILLYKHLKTIEKYPNKLNERDIKMTNFKSSELSMCS